jgi:hypothetical protein
LALGDSRYIQLYNLERIAPAASEAKLILWVVLACSGQQVSSKRVNEARPLSPVLLMRWRSSLVVSTPQSVKKVDALEEDLFNGRKNAGRLRD